MFHLRPENETNKLFGFHFKEFIVCNYDAAVQESVAVTMKIKINIHIEAAAVAFVNGLVWWWLLFVSVSKKLLNSIQHCVSTGFILCGFSALIASNK